eukprot:884422_1
MGKTTQQIGAQTWKNWELLKCNIKTQIAMKIYFVLMVVVMEFVQYMRVWNTAYQFDLSPHCGVVFWTCVSSYNLVMQSTVKEVNEGIKEWLHTIGITRFNYWLSYALWFSMDAMAGACVVTATHFYFRDALHTTQCILLFTMYGLYIACLSFVSVMMMMSSRILRGLGLWLIVLLSFSSLLLEHVMHPFPPTFTMKLAMSVIPSNALHYGVQAIQANRFAFFQMTELSITHALVMFVVRIVLLMNRIGIIMGKKADLKHPMKTNYNAIN